MTELEDDGFVTVWPDRAECDFSIPSRVVAFTQCAYCARTIPQSLAFVGQVHGCPEHFCNEEHANLYTLERLREAGL